MKKLSGPKVSTFDERARPAERFFLLGLYLTLIGPIPLVIGMGKGSTSLVIVGALGIIGAIAAVEYSIRLGRKARWGR